MKQKAKNPLPNTVSITAAQTHFDQIIEWITRNGERFVITNRGEPQAVIMPIEEFRKIIAHRSPQSDY